MQQDRLHTVWIARSITESNGSSKLRVSQTRKRRKLTTYSLRREVARQLWRVILSQLSICENVLEELYLVWPPHCQKVLDGLELIQLCMIKMIKVLVHVPCEETLKKFSLLSLRKK